VINSVVKGTYAGIYQPQRDSRLLVQDSTVEGMTGIVIKGGTATLCNCTVYGTREDGYRPSDDEVKGSKNGWLDTGAGVYVEANYDWAEEIAVTIAGSIISSKTENLPDVLIVGEKADAVRANSDFTDTENKSFTIG